MFNRVGGNVGEPLTLHWVAGLAKVSASAIGCGLQAETFEKFATDGALAARRYLGKTAMLCVNKPFGSELPPFPFRFQAAVEVLQRF